MSDVVLLTLRTALDAAVEFDGITGDRFATLGASEISALPAWAGARAAQLGDFFLVSGERAARVRVEGCSSLVHGLGARMAAGELYIEGDAGDDLGAAMSGGSIEIRGNAGDDAGEAMAGGLLQIHGNAGDRIGGVAPGAAKGMTGGEIIVDGHVGRDAAARLRRGLLVVGGDTGRSAWPGDDRRNAAGVRPRRGGSRTRQQARIYHRLGRNRRAAQLPARLHLPAAARASNPGAPAAPARDAGVR